MKVLIVAEQLDIQDYLRQLAPDPAINFFQYTHPLKAMDNLEEINPAIILWNVDDFPRHWKSFLPFCHALFPLAMPQFHLVSESPLSDEEEGKAEALAVNGIHSQGFFNESLAEILVHEKSDIMPEANHLTRTPTIPAGTGIIQLQHPKLRRLLIGDLLAADQKSLVVRFHGEELAGSFKRNMIIEHAVFQVNDISVEVMLRLSVINDDGSYQFLIMQFL